MKFPRPTLWNILSRTRIMNVRPRSLNANHHQMISYEKNLWSRRAENPRGNETLRTSRFPLLKTRKKETYLTLNLRSRKRRRPKNRIASQHQSRLQRGKQKHAHLNNSLPSLKSHRYSNKSTKQRRSAGEKVDRVHVSPRQSSLTHPPKTKTSSSQAENLKSINLVRLQRSLFQKQRNRVNLRNQRSPRNAATPPLESFPAKKMKRFTSLSRPIKRYIPFCCDADIS